MVIKMLENVVDQMSKGIIIDDYIIYAKGTSKGRFREGINLRVYLKQGEQEYHVLDIKVFYGRPPHHSPWVELFNISNNSRFGDKVIEYFDSVFEDKLLSIFSQALKKGESIFVEYY